MRMVVIGVVVFLAVAKFGSWAVGVGSSATERPDLIRVQAPRGPAVEVPAAWSTAEHRIGLSETVVPPESGLLLAYEADSRERVWNKGVPYPIDVVALDADGQVLAVRTLRVCRRECPLWDVKRPYRYLWELRKGMAKGLRLNAGEKVELVW